MKREVLWPCVLIGSMWCWYIVFTGEVDPVFGSRLAQIVLSIPMPIAASLRLWKSREYAA